VQCNKDYRFPDGQVQAVTGSYVDLDEVDHLQGVPINPLTNLCPLTILKMQSCGHHMVILIGAVKLDILLSRVDQGVKTDPTVLDEIENGEQTCFTHALV